MRLPLALCCAAALAAQDPPTPGPDQPDHVVEIGVLPARLRYDTERFSVRPGSRVTLTLVNDDAMQHNLLILRPGEGVVERVGDLALRLGAKAMERQFVPDTPDVLFHTRAILPQERDTIRFIAPTEPGEYPYVCTLPGHVYTMRGVMLVGDAAPEPVALLDELRYRVYEGRWQQLPDFATLAPAAEGTLAAGVIDIAGLGRRQGYGVRFDGVLGIPQPGTYTFGLNSDDGSRIHIDGRVVVEWDGTHPGGEERTGSIDLDAGEHALRVDFFQAGGGQLLRVSVRGPGLERTELTAAAAPEKPPGIPLAVHHRPRVIRVHVEGAAARSIAVGLPAGVHYCFDADRCSVQFGWLGPFLDVGPDRAGRGGQPCKTLGPRFDVGDCGFPLRAADGSARPVRYLGYRLGASPRFALDWDGRAVTWTIEPAPSGVGLRYTFTVAGPAEDLRFVYDPRTVHCTSEAGSPADGILPIAAATAGNFSLTISPIREEDR